jgi:EF hand
MKIPAYCFLRGTLGVLFIISAFSVAQAEEGKDIKAVPPGVLKKYDANKDGALDESEKAAMEADKAKKKAEGEAKRLEKFDTNKDGKLDEAEIAAEKAAKKEAAEKKKAEMEKKKAEKEAAAPAQ